MSKHLRCATVAAVLVLLGLQAAAGSAQATLVKLSVPRLGAMAHTIVVARVQASAPRHVAGRGRGTIVTDTRLRVEDVLKGAAPATLTLHLPGGSVGGVREVVEDVPVLTPGARYILFLDEQRRIVGWSEGTLPVVGGAVPALGGAPLRAAEGVIRRAADGLPASKLPQPAGEATLPQPALGLPPVPASRGVDANATVTLLNSGFESGMTGWTMTGSPTWGRSTYRPGNGSYSAYCAQSSIAAPGPYASNMDSWMVAGPFDLSDATSASLVFDTWMDLSSGDWLAFGFSTDGSNFTEMGWQWFTSGGWLHETMDLGNFSSTSFLGQPQVWVGFEFISNSGSVAEGAYVDNVLLTKKNGALPTITNISPASASAGTGTQVTLTGTGFGATQGIGQVNFYYDGNDTIQGPVTSWSDTQIVCTVPIATVNGYPASSGSGPVSVLDGSSNLGPGYDGFSVPFGYGGTKWSGLGMTYRVDPNTSDTASEEALVDAGASTWNGDSKFVFTDGGLCSTTAKALDGHNDILWGTGLPSGVLAQATYWYSGSTLTEADIEFNDDYTWNDGTSGSYDIQSIATHELGHTLNLRDLYGPRDTSKVMYGYGSSGVQKRSLDPGDAAGIAWIYGVFVPMSGTMVVNGDAAYTKSTAVTLDSAIVSATQMRFRNQGDAWPAWESYSATKSWTLAAGADGTRTVEAQFKDASANVYAQSDSITLDATPPTTGQSGGGPAWRKVDTTVTFSPTDGGSGMSGGSAKTEYSTNGGTSWTTGASLTIVADPVGHTTDGVHTISYRSTDAIGNLEATKTTTVNIDTTPPVSAQTGGGSAWHNADATVTFTPTDGGSGMSGGSAGTWCSTDGGAHWTAGTGVTVHVDAVGHTADGVHTISYYSTDAIGNVEATRTTTVNVDTQAPTTGVSGADALWHKTDVALTLTPVDAGPAGMSGGPAKTEYSTNGGASWSTGTSVTVRADGALHSTDGSNTVTWRSTDAAGNTETPAPTATVLIDTTGPATTPSGADAAWHDSDVSVTFSALDAGSGMSGGLAGTEYSTDGGAHWATGTQVTVAADPVAHTTDGVTTISYRSTDSIGNVAPAQTCEARIDTSPPVTTASTTPSHPSGWYGSDVTVTLTPHDAGAGMSGGSAGTEYSTDGGLTWLPGTSLTVTADTAAHLLDGPHAVAYRSSDALGHTETAQTLTVNLDTVRPTTRAPAAATVTRGKVASLRYRVGDAAPSAGSVTVTIKLRNRHNKVVATLHPGAKTANPLTTYRAHFRCKLAKGRYRFTIYAVDAAGNPQLRAASRTLTVR